jgi:hypothetical protein
MMLFDDLKWMVRYLVLETGKLLPGKMILISPMAVDDMDWQERVLTLNLSRKQLESSPLISERKPVFLQKETGRAKEPAWPFPWESIALAPGTYPANLALPSEETNESGMDENKFITWEKRSGDTHLRSTLEVLTYEIGAKDGEIGTVMDFIVEDRVTWAIRYMVVDTGRWLPGKKVLVPVHWIDSVIWKDRKVNVNLSKESLRECPEYDPSQPVNREYEETLYDYHGKPAYWNR